MQTKLVSRIVRWDITQMCNLTCQHCYNILPSRRELSTPHIFVILEKLLTNGLNELNLSGREPTMRNDLPQIIHWCSLNKIRVNLATNGTLLDYQMLMRFATHLNMIVYSVDGPDSFIHDMIRGPGNFIKTTNNIRECKRFVKERNPNLKFGISCTLSKINKHKITDMVSLCCSLEVDFLVINPICFCGSANGAKKQLYIDNSDVANAWCKVCAEYSRIQPAFALYLGTLPMEARLLNVTYDLNLPVIQSSCSAGKSLYINPFGEALPCYMIPPLAISAPEFARFLRPWRILDEPVSYAMRAFKPFVTFAHKHTQQDTKECADCPDRTYCRPCPLLTHLDKESITRCQVARKQLLSFLNQYSDTAIPYIKSQIVWKISRAKLITSFRKGDFTSEKEFNISPIAKSIWHMINGQNTLVDIASKIATRQRRSSFDEIKNKIKDFIDFLTKEGIVEKKHRAS